MRLIAVLLLVVGALAALGFARREDRIREQDRLATIASDLAGRKVGVHCPGFLSSLVDTHGEAGRVQFDEAGRPSFNALQNGSSRTSVVYYVFDVMIVAGRDLQAQPLEARRTQLEQKVLPALTEPVRYAGDLSAGLRDLVHAVKSQGFEGLVAKRRDSRYESGLRSGAWLKMRINQSHEFVIGGYTVGTRTFDALILGYYQGNRLLYAARARNGFTPALRDRLFKAFQQWEIPECPFANLPEARSGRWGEGLTKAKMAACRWLKPVLVGQVAFVEWTADHHLRHATFIFA